MLVFAALLLYPLGVHGGLFLAAFLALWVGGLALFMVDVKRLGVGKSVTVARPL